ncbi:MAG TPA: hypothetical protein VHX12_13780, partial [Acidisoma sp.]|nr:hypothetical protein [Acidisoma sp.]
MHGHPDAPDTMQSSAIPYYLEHFREVLRSVECRYGFLLSAGEHRYVARLDRSSQPAEMLYARLVNRKGPCFRIDKLDYADLPDLTGAIHELGENGLLGRWPPSTHAAGAEPILRCFTMPELAASLRHYEVVAPRRRPDLVSWLTAWDRFPDWLTSLLSRFPVVGLAAEDPWPFFRFLYFGELRDNLSDFVVRELGFVVPERIASDQVAVKFGSRGQAEDAFRMARVYQHFRAIRDVCAPREMMDWWTAQAIDRSNLAAGVEILDRLIDRLGRRLERAGEHALALSLYATSPEAPSRERQARLLMKEGRLAEAAVLAQAMTDGPRSTDEAYAARHLLRRLRRTGPNISDARRLQKMGRTIHVTDRRSSVEIAALDHYRRKGWDGVHAENWLWLST